MWRLRLLTCVAAGSLAASAAGSNNGDPWHVLAQTRSYGVTTLPSLPVQVHGTNVGAAVFTNRADAERFAARADSSQTGSESLAAALRKQAARTAFKRQSLLWVWRKTPSNCCPQEIVSVKARSGYMRVTVRSVLEACPGCAGTPLVTVQGILFWLPRSFTGTPKGIAVNIAPDRTLPAP